MLEKGQVVISTAGRDKNNLFVVVEVDDSFALIADGDIRKIERPKRKNIRHLQKTNKHLDLNEILGNKSLRIALKSL